MSIFICDCGTRFSIELFDPNEFDRINAWNKCCHIRPKCPDCSSFPCVIGTHYCKDNKIRVGDYRCIKCDNYTCIRCRPYDHYNHCENFN